MNHEWFSNERRPIKTSDPPEAGEEMLKTTPVFRFWPVTVDPRPGHQLFETFPFSSENHVLNTICTLHYNAVRPPLEDRFHSLFNSQEIFQTSRLGSHLKRSSHLERSSHLVPTRKDLPTWKDPPCSWKTLVDRGPRQTLDPRLLDY